MYLCVVLYTGPVLQNLNFITFLSQFFTGIFRSYSFFIGANVRKGVAEGSADCVPIFLSQIPSLFYNKIFKPTISLIQVGLLFHFFYSYCFIAL
jgi:acyl-CoA hydrolase